MKINWIIFVKNIMNYVVQIELQKLKVKEMDNIIIVMYVIMKILQMKKKKFNKNNKILEDLSNIHYNHQLMN